MGRYGYAKSAERQACKLQDTSGVEGGRRAAQECYGQECVPPPLLLDHSDIFTVNKKSLVKEIFGDQA